MWRRRRGVGRVPHRSAEDATSPREKYEEFARDSRRIRREVEEALSDLEKLAGLPEERKHETA